MDMDLSPDQQLLRDSARGFLKDHWSIAEVQLYRSPGIETDLVGAHSVRTASRCPQIGAAALVTESAAQREHA